MVFSSLEFLLLFLPATFVAASIALAYSTAAVVRTMLVASLIYYGLWNWQNLFVLVPLAILTYVGALAYQRGRWNGWALAVVAANLGALAYFKYAAFFAETLRAVWSGVPALVAPALPLGISFFVFQKIAFMIDVKRGIAKAEPGLSRFLLFVSFFPQLIAGPIVHWRELGPQLNRETMLAQRDVALGLTLFLIGLAKKTLLADLLSPYVAEVFDRSPATAGPLGAWAGVLAYTLQIYFDFSGYSDMAIGLALLFGIRLPWNFLSPYQAGSIVEFWRRWHITLSHFLRDYLYIPLGGNRYGPLRRYRNILVTMLLGGLWHGAGWNFVLWGGAHGGMIVAQHAWNSAGFRLPAWIAYPLTLLCVMLAWVMFRANSVGTAAELYGSMLGASGQGMAGAPGPGTALLLLVGTAIALFAPNVRGIAESLRLTPRMAIWCGILGAAALLKQLYAGEIHEFIYFRF